ncbi:MAG TPA: hypothetical protein VFN26_24200 [Candidatus Acidoferrum sp.]|nr:hypothetical protein [Candidatus Acidoferrum sp.]
MGLSKTPLLILCAASLCVLTGSYGQSRASLQSPQGPATVPRQGAKEASPEAPALTRGKKLVLKDGSFQLVRDYQRTGERVRYYSSERGDWEELPAAMVDWDATAKAEVAEHAEEDALAKKIRAQEQARKIETIMDVDASLEVGPGVFLPPGEGMFVLEGKSVTQLEQVGSEIKTDKKQFLKQVLSPIPIVPGKRNIQIPGPRAKVRVIHNQVEFYLREAPPDPDRTTPIVKSSRPGEIGPEVELVRATVKGNRRQLESIKSQFGEQVEENRATIAIQRWEIAPTVYRFTLGEALPPGEYALAEILPDGMNLFVWDFGVDAAAGPKAGTLSKKN